MTCPGHGRETWTGGLSTIPRGGQALDLIFCTERQYRHRRHMARRSLSGSFLCGFHPKDGWLAMKSLAKVMTGHTGMLTNNKWSCTYRAPIALRLFIHAIVVAVIVISTATSLSISAATALVVVAVIIIVVSATRWLRARALGRGVSTLDIVVLVSCVRSHDAVSLER